jgi:hypothetical protein
LVEACRWVERQQTALMVDKTMICGQGLTSSARSGSLNSAKILALPLHLVVCGPVKGSDWECRWMDRMEMGKLKEC